jgi:hypothetical protein
MIDPTYIRQAREFQAALEPLVPDLDVHVYETSAGLIQAADVEEYDALVCIVRASEGDRSCLVPVSRPLIEHELMSTIVNLVLPEIRRRLRPI